MALLSTPGEFFSGSAQRAALHIKNGLLQPYLHLDILKV